MIKRIALLMVIFILSLSTSALAAEPGDIIIEGQVVNGTEGGSSVANQEITLNAYLNDTELNSTITKTDSEGRFVFDSLSTEPGNSYQVTLTFQEVDYSSEWLSFDDSETSRFTEVTVFDSTTSDEAIKVEMAHTIIYIEEGSLLVMEYLLFVNEADRTYIGSKEINTDGTKETLRFSLPEEATELQPKSGLMECCIYSSEEGFVDTMPVLPGDAEVLYSYRVDYNSGAYTFSRNVNYPTVNYDLLIQGESSKVISDQLTTAEPFDIDGTWFNHVSGTDLILGNTLVARLSDLPEVSNQGSLIWVTLAMVVLAGGFSFGYLLKRKKAQPLSPEDTLDQRRQGLLIELAQLDDDFEGGRISEEVYRKQRAEKKVQLVELIQKPKEKRDSG